MGKPKRVRLVAADEQGIVRGACVLVEEETAREEKETGIRFFLFKPSLRQSID